MTGIAILALLTGLLLFRLYWVFHINYQAIEILTKKAKHTLNEPTDFVSLYDRFFSLQMSLIGMYWQLDKWTLCDFYPCLTVLFSESSLHYHIVRN